MPGYESDQVAIDNTVQNRRLGSVMLTLGWILLWCDAIILSFFFVSLRDGSMFYPIWIAVQGFIGLVLIILGTNYRRSIGPTGLSRRDLAKTRALEERERAEQQHVA
jgi:hypothetical protein